MILNDWNYQGWRTLQFNGRLTLCIFIMFSSGCKTVLWTFWSNPLPPPSGSKWLWWSNHCSLCHVLDIALCQEIKMLLTFLKSLIHPSSGLSLRTEVIRCRPVFIPWHFAVPRIPCAEQLSVKTSFTAILVKSINKLYSLCLCQCQMTGHPD